ncbi:GH36-type glycosyl hydrolase domain-containing protein [Pediococcus siamensis]|uniref:alpha-L-rhamnosidase-related protein n=1 Tax=Pediococcus siamensis TaxID=381829 RepID=UPI0039A0D655
MAKWIWYHGDFEIYQAMKQNLDREERGMKWPAYWYTSGWNHNVFFSRTFSFATPQTFSVRVQGEGYGKFVDLDSQKETKFAFAAAVTCPAGKYRIEIYVANLAGLPCAYLDGQQVQSDENWQASNFLGEPVSVGTSSLFRQADQNPMEVDYHHEIRQPQKIESVNGGVLLDFGHDLTARTRIKFKNGFQQVTISYGESRTEALDVQDTYLKHTLQAQDDPFGHYDTQKAVFVTKLRAFRYIYLPQISKMEDLGILEVDFESLEFPRIAKFSSHDEQLTKIWQVSDRTLRLCSGIFFIDGVKRDRWVWAGDAFQCFYMNRYDFFDKEIVERTLLGLRGELDIKQHLDTIVDYSMYWIISIELYYDTFADKHFVQNVYAKLKRLMDFSLEATDEHGFIRERKGDWIYIDWADFDHQGPLAAEQMVLARALQSMVRVSKLLNQDAQKYERHYQKLRENIDRYFWDPTQQAYIDSYESKKRHVTRHANIFAILFGYVDDAKAKQLVQRVLMNPEIPEIKTPYFKFWEQEAFAKMGHYDQVLATIKAYWGGMLNNGATTFWEYFDPAEKGAARYAMYGDKYGKSLCHAWGASPLYLIGRYLIGLKPTQPGYQTFEIKPQLELLGDFQGKLPLSASGDYVELHVKDNVLTVQATKAGGIIRVGQQKIAIPVEKAITMTV